MAVTLLICIHQRSGFDASCGGSGSQAILDELRRQVAEAGLPVKITPIRCFGYCREGPNVRVEGGTFWHGCTVEDVPRILAEAMENLA